MRLQSLESEAKTMLLSLFLHVNEPLPDKAAGLEPMFDVADMKGGSCCGTAALVTGGIIPNIPATNIQGETYLHGSHFFGLTNFPDFSSIFFYFPVFLKFYFSFKVPCFSDCQISLKCMHKPKMLTLQLTSERPRQQA